MAELFKTTAPAFEAFGVVVPTFGLALSLAHLFKRISRVLERHEAFRELRRGF